MALLLAWVSLGASALLAAACAILHFDRSGQRRTIAALQQQVAGLTRDVAVLSATVDPQGEKALLSPAHALARTAALPSSPSSGLVSAPPASVGEAVPTQSGRRSTPEPIEPAPVTRPGTAPGDARAARTSSTRPPPPVELVYHEAQPPPQLLIAAKREITGRE